MKTSYQILIIVSICALLFVARSDVKIVYDRTASYLSDTLHIPGIHPNTISIKSDEASAGSINTPGALKVTAGLANDANHVKLSIKDVIDWTNSNRAANGNLPPLKENSELDFSAQIKLNDMFKQQYFEHVSPDGVDIKILADKVSYDYIMIGENLALGNFKDAQSLLDAWMASPGHRANILKAHYTEIGVAVGHSTYKGEDIWMAVQHFGAPQSACPNIDEVLYGKSKLDGARADSMESDLVLRKAQIDSGAVHGGKTTNEQIAEYNSLIATYNQLLADLQKETSIYNAQVRGFNSCRAKVVGA